MVWCVVGVLSSGVNVTDAGDPMCLRKVVLGLHESTYC